jgi:acetyltransferase-like isoleucine patch superfamily enzyme
VSDATEQPGSRTLHRPNPDRSRRVGKSLIKVGAFTYGDAALTIHQWREGAGLTIGRFCSIADEVSVFLGGNHRVDWITTYPFGHIHVRELGGADVVGHPATKGDVVIGHDVWIGHGATIMSGVAIGNGAVIGAQSVVVKDVAPYTIVGGNPAREIGQRFPPDIIALLQKLAWWDLDAAVIRTIVADLSTAPDAEMLRALITRLRGPQAD